MGGVALLIEHDAEHGGGDERVGHVPGGVARPGDDLHLLVPQLRGHRPLAHPARPDAGPLGIEIAGGRLHRDLGATPGLAGDRPDHHLA